MNYDAKTAEFVQLLTSHQRRLFLYISTFLPNTTDAEEVLQETNKALWMKAGEYTAGRQFFAWAHTFAHFQVLAFRKRRKRDRLTFSDDLLESLASEAVLDEEDQSLRRRSLAKCLAKTQRGDRELLVRRYGTNSSVQQLAQETGRPVSSIYRSLERVRLALLVCIQRSIAIEEGSE